MYFIYLQAEPFQDTLKTCKNELYHSRNNSENKVLEENFKKAVKGIGNETGNERYNNEICERYRKYKT